MKNTKVHTESAEENSEDWGGTYSRWKVKQSVSEVVISVPSSLSMCPSQNLFSTLLALLGPLLKDTGLHLNPSSSSYWHCDLVYIIQPF